MRGKKDMFCKYCENQIPENSNFCSKCGNKLSITEKTTFTPHPTENTQLLGNQKMIISLIVILLLAELGLCCFQIYKVTDSSEMLSYFQDEAATAQYIADSYYSTKTKAQERIYGKDFGRAIRDAEANQAWEYVSFAEKELRKNIILLVLFIIVFLVTMLSLIKTRRKFIQN